MSAGTAAKADIAATFQRYGHEVVKRGGKLFTLCPHHAEKTPSCLVDEKAGTYYCFGCRAHGDTIDLVKHYQRVSYPEALAILGIGNHSPAGYIREQQRPAPTPPPVATDDQRDRERIAKAARVWRHCVAIEDTPAAWYVESRGIPSIFAKVAGARYCADFLGRGPAVAFPISAYDADARVWRGCAVHGRLILPPANPSDPVKLTIGPLRGLFRTALGAAQAEYLAVAEAPLDALALAAVGLPAVATIGTGFPAWLPSIIHGRRVILAHDADKAGDDAAQRLARAIHAAGEGGGGVYRVKPGGEVKDWAQYAEVYGLPALERAVLAAALPHLSPCLPVSSSWRERIAQARVRLEEWRAISATAGVTSTLSVGSFSDAGCGTGAGACGTST